MNSSSFPREYYLVANPFDPQTGDRRDLDKTPLVGTAKRILEQLIRALESRNVTLALIYGEWGHGKTTMFRKAMKELEKKYKSQVLAIRYRVPRGETVPFGKVIAAALSVSRNCLEKNEIVCESFEDPEQIGVNEVSISEFIADIERVIEEAMKKGKAYVVLGLDQLEMTKIDSVDVNELIMRMRDLVDKYSNRIGFSLVLLATPRWLPRESIDIEAYRRLMGASLIVEEIERLTLTDVKELFCEILSNYRDPQAPKGLSPYHPFTEEAINEIYKLGNGVPRRIYEIASRLLNEGVPPPIDVDQVLLYSGIVKRQWYEALNMPLIELRTLVCTALKVASMFTRAQILPGRIITIPTDAISLDHVSGLVAERGEARANPRQIVNELRKAADIIVYVQLHENIYAYLIKVTNRRIDKKHLDHAIEFVKKYTLKFQGRAIPSDSITILFISRRISRTVKDQTDLIEVLLPFPISIKYVEIAEDDEDKPERYGVLRWIYEEYNRCKDNISCLENIKDDVKYIVRSILQVDIES